MPGSTRLVKKNLLDDARQPRAAELWRRERNLSRSTGSRLIVETGKKVCGYQLNVSVQIVHCREEEKKGRVMNAASRAGAAEQHLWSTVRCECS